MIDMIGDVVAYVVAIVGISAIQAIILDSVGVDSTKSIAICVAVGSGVLAHAFLTFAYKIHDETMCRTETEPGGRNRNTADDPNNQ